MAERRPPGVAALGVFFAAGSLIALVAAVSLLSPGGLLEPMWRLNPRARTAFSGLGVAAPALLVLVAAACGVASVGVFRRRRWGHRTAVGLISVNLVGDTVNAALGIEPRAAVGIPIAGALLVYLLSRRVRGYFGVGEGRREAGAASPPSRAPVDNSPVSRAPGVDVRVLGSGDATVLDRVAPGVLDRGIVAELKEEFLRDPRHHIAVAIEDGTVVAFASGVHYVHPDKPTELWINEVGVSPGHQRRGLGGLVVRALIAHGGALGCVNAWVLTDRANAAAMRLYASCGGVEAPGDTVMFEFPLGPPPHRQTET